MSPPASDIAPRPCRLCGSCDLADYVRLGEMHTVICRQCGLVQMARAYSLDVLTEIYDSLEEEPELLRSSFAEKRVLRVVRFRAGRLQRYTGLRSGRILEVGSAQGHFLAELRSRGFEVLGVEPSSYGAARHREKGIPVINDFLERADLPERTFDAISLFHVLEHLEEPLEAARRFHSLLKSGGHLVVEVPDIFSFAAKFEKNPWNLFKKEHICYYSASTLPVLMERAGFRQVAAPHHDHDGFRLPFGMPLKKMLWYLFNRDFPGLLDRLARGEPPSPAPGRDAAAPAQPPGKPRSPFRLKMKTLRKTLSAPLDMLFGYLAYRLDLGVNLFWVGRKEP
ncbi:MAG: methyltransferase domain-containing protein [Deltaproteobacteria bacterium]|nr:methyltransferase domain-containing protein [Deltaproteobacteria bacterium]MBM4285164.1 methyltransferase domain-containing protein [Deltaproteobacteria bacterium]